MSRSAFADSSDQAPADNRDHEAFKHTWSEPKGLLKLATVNNDPIGMGVMIAAFSFLLIGGVLALIMRLQLAVPENTLVGPDVFNQLFTMHGSTMMYLFAVPFLEGLVIMMLPPMIGSRDMAFPRISALGFWSFIFSGLMFYAGFIVGAVPDVGWFAYTPLSGPRYAGLGTDFWLLGLGMAEFAGISAGIEIVVTVLKMRAPGMTLGRMPMFAWTVLVAGLMIIFAFTTLLTATMLLEMDRLIGTKFFDPAHGGNPLLWQHLFWFFGHPEVYIIFLPATGIVSMIVAGFSKRLVGYTLIATAVVVTGFVSFGLWVHHMYTTGLPELSMHFFAAASLMIAIASGTQIFAWIASLWGSRPVLATPLLFVLGFIFIFVLGGLTGVMVAVVPFDWQVHDTYFIVAHFHYVLIGGAVFPILGGLYYWIPKMTGRMLSERLGKWSFWLSFVGFNAAFFPMHLMGFWGMPRRVYTYPAMLGIGWLNMIATIGAFILAGGFLVFVINVLLSNRGGNPAGANPWGADTLEWSLPSPMPAELWYAPPIVRSRHPVWRQDTLAEGEPELVHIREALAGRPEHWRASLVTDALTSRPQAITWLPRTSWMPLLVASAGTLASAALLVKAHLLAIACLIPIAIGIYVWLRPDDEKIRLLRRSDLPQRSGLPIFVTGSKSLNWWGAVGLLAILGTVAATLVYSYFYIRLYSDQWPQGEIAKPAVLLPMLFAGIMALTSAGFWWAQRRFADGRRWQTRLALVLAAAGGIVFLAADIGLQLRSGFSPGANAYASCYYAMSWMVDLYVVTALAVLMVVLARITRHPDDPPEVTTLHLQIAGLLWQFTVVVSVLAYAILYVSPHLI